MSDVASTEIEEKDIVMEILEEEVNRSARSDIWKCI